MERKTCVKLILLDFGHPMDETTVETVKVSCLNAVSLMLVRPDNARMPKVLGVSVVNSNLSLISYLSGTNNFFNSLSDILQMADARALNNVKVTVNEYKAFFRSTFVNVLNEVRNFEKMAGPPSPGSIDSDFKSRIDLAIVSKKTGSILSQMIKDVLDKLSKEDEDLGKAMAKLKVKILQVTNERVKVTSPSPCIACCTCTGTVQDLNLFFKGFLFKSEHGQEVKIIISKCDNLTVECDVYDCIVNPFMADTENVWTNTGKGIHSGHFAPKGSLEILGRIPLSGLCPTLVFGVSYRARARSSQHSSLNARTFARLCRTLATDEQGLLARTRFRLDSIGLANHYYLTSDGNTLLINCVAPEELYLSTRSNVLPRSSDEDDDRATADDDPEEVVSVVESSLQQIPVLEEYSPTNYPSGLYAYLKHRLLKSVTNELFTIREKREGKRKQQSGQGFAVQKRVKTQPEGSPLYSGQSTNKAGQQHNGPTSKSASTHPALLSPKSTRRYKHSKSRTYQLPELSSYFTDDLI